MGRSKNMAGEAADCSPNETRQGPLDVDTTTFEKFFYRYSQGLLKSLFASDLHSITTLAHELMAARARRAQIFILGNGGSAANASHFATDLAKDRFGIDKYLFRVMSLVDNSALITATANDYGYEDIFERQLRRHMQPGDIVMAISSSGNSPNVLKAVEYAREHGARTFGIVGFGGGRLGEMVDVTLDIKTAKGHYGFMEDVTSIYIHMVSIYMYERDCVEINKRNKAADAPLRMV